MDKVTRSSSTYFLVYLSIIALILTCLSHAAHAAAEPYIYSPAGCGFEARFPAEPGFNNRCPSDPDAPCFEVAQFTKRSDDVQRYSLEMSCVAQGAGAYDSHDESSLKNIIMQMIIDTNLPEAPKVSYEENAQNSLKIASASGLMRKGFTDKIFMAQVWVNEGSIMSVEGVMDLTATEDDEKEFVELLQSIKEKSSDQKSTGASHNN